MTIAQQLEQKGIEKGRQEGRKEGRQEGRKEGREEGSQEARLDIARNMLKDGIDKASVMKMTGLTEEDLKQIRN